MSVEKVHEWAGEQEEVRNGLSDVRQVLGEQVVDADSAGDEHEDAQWRPPA
jgi:hypothetical protein